MFAECMNLLEHICISVNGNGGPNRVPHDSNKQRTSILGDTGLRK